MSSHDTQGRRDDVVDELRSVWRDAAEAGQTHFPGESTLASMLGVSRPTLREALIRLEEEGLVRRRHGAQTVVNTAALEVAGRFDRQSDFSATLEQAGYRADRELLLAERLRLSEPDAARLGVVDGTSGMRVVKRWLADGRPARVAIDVFAVTHGVLDRINPNDSLLDLAAELMGEPVLWELAVPGAVAADATLAEWLEISVGDPLLALDTIGVTRSGRRAFVTRDHYVPGIVPLGFIRSVG